MPAHPFFPGQIVPSTATYNLVDEVGQVTGRHVVLEEGTIFPPTNGGREHRYKLDRIVKTPKQKRRGSDDEATP
jgi:hypothetical protein